MTDSLDANPDPHACGHGGAPVLDTAVLDDLVSLGGDEGAEFLEEIIGLFFQDASARVGAIRSSVEAGQVEPIERAAHALKSSSANVGALVFAGVCKEVEALARANELEELAREIPRLVAMFEEVKHALEHFPSGSADDSREA